MKRAIRVGLYDSKTKVLKFNTAQVTAEWKQDKTDVWTVSDKTVMNPIMFRTT
jgi:hypothetical protein